MSRQYVPVPDVELDTAADFARLDLGDVIHMQEEDGAIDTLTVMVKSDRNITLVGLHGRAIVVDISEEVIR